eukprot:972907_1
MSFFLYRLALAISLIYIIHVNGYKHHRYRHHRKTVTPQQQRSRHARLRYAHAKTIDYDKLLKWQEMEDLQNLVNENSFEEEEEEMMHIDRRAISTAGNNQNANGVSPFAQRADAPGAPRTNKIKVKWPRLPNTEGHAGEDAGGVFYSPWSLFKWHDYTTKYDTGMYKTGGHYPSMYKKVLKLRNEVMVKLLEDTGGFNGNRQCFDNMGSVKAKSDLDFTWVRWDQPQNVVGYLIHFYIQCKAATGSYPAAFGDMNFYIASPYASNKPLTTKATDFSPIATNRNCWNTVPANIQAFFSRVDDSSVVSYQLHVFAGKQSYVTAKNYKRDLFMGFYLLEKRFASDKPLEPPFALKYLIKFSKAFYNQMHRANTGAMAVSDINKMYCHSLLYWMNYHSDESYVGNIALIDIWLAMKSERGALALGIPNPKPDWRERPTSDEVFFMMLDQFAFVKSYYEKAKGDVTLSEKQKVLHFIDRICKYLDRIYDFADTYIAGWSAKNVREGISEATRKKFNKFRAITHIYSPHRGDVAEKAVERATANADGNGKEQCAYVLQQARTGSLKTTKTMDVTELWKEYIKDLVTELTNHFDSNSFLPPKERGDIRTGMKTVFSKIDSYIKLKSDGIRYDDGATKKDGSAWPNDEARQKAQR